MTNEEYMCPFCVTPWKCNGPHIDEYELDNFNLYVEDAIAAAGRTSTLSHTTIAELLLSNMFDGQCGGIVAMDVDDMIEEVTNIIMEYLHNE
jgi:hypothetical protein